MQRTSIKKVWRGLNSAIVTMVCIMALGLFAVISPANATIVVADNTNVSFNYGVHEAPGDVVLTFMTGESAMTFHSLSLYADFNDESAIGDPMRIGFWDSSIGDFYGKFDTGSIGNGFGVHLATANPYGIYVPAFTGFSILVEERDGGAPNEFEFVGGFDQAESDNLEFFGTSIIGAGFLGGDVKFSLTGVETVEFNALADSFETFTATVVPEPGSYSLILSGCVIAFVIVRRRR